MVHHHHLHRRGHLVLDHIDVHQHQHERREPQFWDKVEDTWNSWFGPDDDEEEDNATNNRHQHNDRQANGASTVVRTVYETLEPTFSGEIGGYRTRREGDDDDDDDEETTTSKRTRAPRESTTHAAGDPVMATTRTTTTSSEEESTTTIPSVISKVTKSSIESTLAVAVSTPTLAPSPTRPISADRVGETPSASASSDASVSTDSGPSTGAKAGIAIGVLAGVLLIGVLAFWLFNRRKRQMERDQAPLDRDHDHEKINPFGAPQHAVAAAVPPPTTAQRSGPAPRLSLRPVTQFLPNLNFDKRNSKGANLMLNSAPAGGYDNRLAPSDSQGSLWDRPTTSESANPNNPFGQQAERLPTPIAEEPASPMPVSEKPLPPGPETMASAVPPSEAAVSGEAANSQASAMAAAVAGAAAGTVAAGALTRKASIRQDGHKALDLTLPPPPSVFPAPGPPSPAGTEFSETSQSGDHPVQSSSGAAAIAAAGGPANSVVHRVQLDFKPTMEDEMELRAGQVVRLLHEYDDGWALCIRLDRSQQGVVPRTCLSTRPVKPRPQNGPGPNNGPGPGPRGPPRGPGGPGGPPRGPGGPPRGPGPNFPPGQRPMGPQGGPHGGPRGPPRAGPGYPRPESPMGHPGRPASPAGRSMSPGPRAQSPGPRFQGPPGGRPRSPSMGPRAQSPGPRFQGPPGGRPRSPSMGPRSESPAGRNRIPQPSRMNPGGSPPQPSAFPPQGRSRAASTASNASGPPTGPVARKPVPGQAL